MSAPQRSVRTATVVLSLLFSGSCIDSTSVAYGFALGLMATGGVMIAFLESWLDFFARLGRSEAQEEEFEAEVDAIKTATSPQALP